MQIHLAHNTTDVNHVYWWKTYSPPIWLLDGRIEHVQTTDFMGMDAEDMRATLQGSLPCGPSGKPVLDGVVFVAPASATYLDQFTNETQAEDLFLQERWRYKHHMNLDDLDFAKDGVWETLKRVVGRRGLVLYDVKRRCLAGGKRPM